MMCSKHTFITIFCNLCNGSSDILTYLLKHSVCNLSADIYSYKSSFFRERSLCTGIWRKKWECKLGVFKYNLLNQHTWSNVSSTILSLILFSNVWLYNQEKLCGQDCTWNLRWKLEDEYPCSRMRLNWIPTKSLPNLKLTYIIYALKFSLASIIWKIQVIRCMYYPSSRPLFYW